MMDLLVIAVRAIARDVLAIDLRARDGAQLPGGAPGSHIDVVLPNGLVRQYSLTEGTPQDTQSVYSIAVARDANSKGGSAWIHDQLRVGQILTVSRPRNMFPVSAEHRNVLLIAGGIGITPILSMARHFAGINANWQVLACARSASRLAFYDELKMLCDAHLSFHFDDMHGGPVDLASWLSRESWDGVYACGPAPMLRSLEIATEHWPAGVLRLERFTKAPIAASSDVSFELILARRGLQTFVGASESILAALERLGIDHPWSCRDGLCGTCETEVLAGEIDHRDCVLDAAAKSSGKRIMPCVSRCSGDRLVLDL